MVTVSLVAGGTCCWLSGTLQASHVSCESYTMIRCAWSAARGLRSFHRRKCANICDTADSSPVLFDSWNQVALDCPLHLDDLLVDLAHLDVCDNFVDAAVSQSC